MTFSPKPARLVGAHQEGKDMAFHFNIQEGNGPEASRIALNQIDLITAINNEICRQVPGIAAEPRLFNAIIAAANSLVDEFAKPIVKATPGMGLFPWLSSDDVGTSSKFMAWVLSYNQFRQPEFGYPRDPDDFGRCRRLVLAEPKFTHLTFELREHGPQWKAVAENWDRWVELYDQDDGEMLYAEMKAAYGE